MNDDGVADTRDRRRRWLRSAHAAARSAFSRTQTSTTTAGRSGGSRCSSRAASASRSRRSHGSPRASRWRSTRGRARCSSRGGSSTTARSATRLWPFAPLTEERASVLPAVVTALRPLDQGTTDTSFRTNAFPTMAFDGAGRVYLAWSARGYASLGRIPSRATREWCCRHLGREDLVDTVPGGEPQRTRPSDHAGADVCAGEASAALLRPARRQVAALRAIRRRTADPQRTAASRAAHHRRPGRAGRSAPIPIFTPFRLSQYRFGGATGSKTLQQLDFNPPNLPLFRLGTTPFLGDYLDVAPETPFVREWIHLEVTIRRLRRIPSSTASGRTTVTSGRRPMVTGPPIRRPIPRSRVLTTSAFDPDEPSPRACPGQAGMRNQNIYTGAHHEEAWSSARSGIRVGSILPRSFPVFAQNDGLVGPLAIRLRIVNQPVGGSASFKQFEQLTSLDVEVPPRSTVARTVFARSTAPHAQINVAVTEIQAPGRRRLSRAGSRGRSS